MKKLILTTLSFLFTFSTLSAQEWQSVVALVVDQKTLSEAGNEIDGYRNAISADGKTTELIVDKWGIPDSIRKELIRLYGSNKLEGVVLIGDIPVPMIRDAQHLTTAFKMDQKRDWKESSIPSDRFYDDFDLKFDYLKQDEDQPLYHYYSLRPDSRHTIECDIYSARIKAPRIPGQDKYTSIRKYLAKVASEKKQSPLIENVLHFSGHGYNSNSMNARVDEAWALREHFPFLQTEPQNKLTFINYTFDDFVKERLMATLADPGLSLAILHHHGAEDTQYLNGSPITSTATRWIEQTKQFFRSKIRSSGDTTEAKQYYIKNYGVPADWVEKAFDPETMASDSLYNASLDIHISDLYGYIPNARFIMLDACFNGSFHLEDYISGHYVFNPGKTLVVKANSVNTLQDIWTNELIGLLDLGVSIGNWAKEQMTLESHLIGDPTFSFENRNSHLSLERAIVKERTNKNFWKKLLTHKLPDVRALAMKFLYKNNALTSTELLAIQQNDPSPVVRLEAFNLNKKINDANLSKAIKLGLTDSYELIQRLSVLTSAQNSTPENLHTLVRLRLDPATSIRVEFQLKEALENYPPEDITKEIKKFENMLTTPFGKKIAEAVEEFTERNYKNELKDFNDLKEPKVTDKNKSFTIKAQRNLTNPLFVDYILDYLRQKANSNELRILTAETLGWYKYSYKKNYIVNQLEEMVKMETDEAVKNEIQKTINRMKL